MPTTITVEDKIQKALDTPKLSPMKKAYAGVGEMVIRLSSFTIKKTEDYEEAMSALRDEKTLRKELEGAKDEVLATPEGFVKSVKELYKAITAPIDLGVKDLKDKMAKFQTDQQRKRDEEAAKLKLKADQEAAKLATADTSKQQAKIEEKVVAIEAKAEAISSFKPKTADKVRKFEVVDPDKVERKYCTPEDKKIRPFIGIVDGPIPDIPGVRIWDEIKIVTR